MKKSCRILCLLLAFALALSLWGCGGAQDDSVLKKGLPEICYSYQDMKGFSPVPKGDEPLAAEHESGKAEYVYLSAASGRSNTLITGVQGGETLMALSQGTVSYRMDEGAVLWAGDRFDCLHINADNAVLPAMYSEKGGILLLDITGECTIAAPKDKACLEGFDSVILTGGGSLTLNTGYGDIFVKGGASLPGLVVAAGSLTAGSIRSDGKGGLNTLVCGGTLRAANLTTGDLCVSGGSLVTGGIACEKASALVFRGGTSVVGTIWQPGGASVVVSGGNVYFSDCPTIKVYAAAGSVTADADALGAVLESCGGKVIDSASADNTFYCSFGLPQTGEGWAPGADKGGIAIDETALEDIGGIYANTRISLDGARLSQLSPWGGGYVAELNGDSSIFAVGENAALCGEAILIRGSGSLSLSGKIGLDMWGSAGRERVVLIIDSGDISIDAENSVSIGSEGASRSTVTLNGGKLSCTGNLWCLNSEFTINGGSLILGGGIALNDGVLTINGGTVELGGIWMKSGSIVINDGNITVRDGGIITENGSVTINGGTVTLPDGKDGISAAGGTVKITGGEIKDLD